MRVLLAQPPLVPGATVEPPLGLVTLAAWLQERGRHTVEILDLDLEVQARTTPDQEACDRVLCRAIDDFAPDVLGVTSMYSNSLQAGRMLRAAKRRCPSLMTVAGGPHFGALGREALERIPELDFSILGEGESAFLDLLRSLQEGTSPATVSSLCYREGGRIEVSPQGPLLDLAELPPVWSSLDGCVELRRYAATIPPDADRRAVYVEAGRGCPYRCSFCATAPFWRRKFRVKPVERIVAEIRFLYDELGYDSFLLVHDLLTVDRRFVERFCDHMIDARLPVRWMANSRSDISLRGLLPKMKAAGCWKLFFGMESASPRVQRSIDKHLDPEAAVAVVDEQAEHGIASTCSFVIGFAEETPEEVSASVGMGARLKILGAENVQFHRLRRWPPATLATGAAETRFDLDSLRIEYPFLSVPQEDVEAIRADPVFFGGYFVPLSRAGTPGQLAQAEMFFHHAVAIAALTLCALHECLGATLVPVFYDLLTSIGALDRSRLDWQGADPTRNWRALSRHLAGLVVAAGGDGCWRRTLLEALFDYERRRLFFASGEGEHAGRAFAGGEEWTSFRSPVDVPAVIERMGARRPLSEDLLKEIGVVLVRRLDGTFASYRVQADVFGAVEARDEELFSSLWRTALPSASPAPAPPT